MTWPLQSDCDEFYGNPYRRGWEAANLVRIVPPWQMHDDDPPHEPIAYFRMHRKVADSLNGILAQIWKLYGRDQARIAAAHLDLFAGSWVLRNIRGGSHPSMHAYGCALDLAGNENPQGIHWRPNHGMIPLDVVKAFEDQGWRWGGRWQRPDCMHFQAARVG